MKRTVLCIVLVLFAVSMVFAANEEIKKQAVVLSGDIFSLSPNTYHAAASNQPAPSARQDDSLWYGTLVYYNAIGLTNGGTFEWAIRLTPTELGPYTGWNIGGIKFYKYTGNLNNVVKVYDNGTQTNPGPMITSEPYTSSAPDEWVTVMLSSPVPIPGTGDLWCSVEGTHNAGEYPAACDAGPAVDFKGDWLYLNGSWSEAQSYGFDYNWMIIAYLEQGGTQDPDIEVLPDTVEFYYGVKGSRQIDTLGYDDGTPDGGYDWAAGTRRAMRMSPAAPCSILTLQYFGWCNGNRTFDATIYDWTGTDPGTQIGAPVNVALSNVHQWYNGDFSGQGLTVTGDFVASFDMNSANAFLGYDAINVGRAWDYDGAAWTAWNETYFIRAIVEYTGPFIDTVQTMMINNVGTADLIIDSIIPADSWIVSVVPNSMTIPAGQADTVDVTVTLNGLGNGVHYSSLDIYSNDPDENPYPEPVKFTVSGTGIGEGEKPVQTVPYTVSIFPNPMNSSGRISYVLPAKSQVGLAIYDISGKLVRNIINTDVEAGTHTAIWDGKNNEGHEVPQGVYFYNFVTPAHSETGKISVIR